MTNAIEVLRSFKCSVLDSKGFELSEEGKKKVSIALGEALLALEQKEIAKVIIEELKADIEMLKAENKELIDKLNACENRCYVFESELK